MHCHQKRPGKVWFPPRCRHVSRIYRLQITHHSPWHLQLRGFTEYFWGWSGICSGSQADMFKSVTCKSVCFCRQLILQHWVSYSNVLCHPSWKPPASFKSQWNLHLVSNYHQTNPLSYWNLMAWGAVQQQFQMSGQEESRLKRQLHVAGPPWYGLKSK